MSLLEGTMLEGRERVWYVVPVVVALFIISLWVQNPAWIFQVQESAEQFGDTASNLKINTSATPTGMFYIAQEEDVDTIYFTKKDIEFMNRLYKETDFEQGYCGILDGDTAEIWKADTINSSQSHVTYTTANCPEAWEFGTKMTVHTQPPGHRGLSDVDLETWRKSDFQYSCVQSGIMPTVEGYDMSVMECFEKAGTTKGKLEYEEVLTKVEN